MNTRTLLFAALSLYFVTQFSALTWASSTVYAIDPAATQKLSEMQAAYNSLNSLSEQIVSAESPDVDHRITVHTQLLILRPGYVSMISDSKSSRSGASEVVTDGQYCYVTAPQYPLRYLQFPVSTDNDALKSALGQNIASSFTLNLFANTKAVSTLFAETRLATLHLAKSIDLNGTPVDIITSTDVDGETITLYVGKSDHLVRKIVALDPNRSGNFTETYISVKADAPLTKDSFTFTPPPKAAPYYNTSFKPIYLGSPTQ